MKIKLAETNIILEYTRINITNPTSLRTTCTHYMYLVFILYLLNINKIDRLLNHWLFFFDYLKIAIIKIH